ncbi:MAG TPA: hypothetical protein VFY13_00325 [Luteolibacter sp.]|nr:hypothetical protein [Luteolibacter sp.]
MQDETTPATKNHLPTLPFYKPNARGTGAVVRFGLSAPKGALFVEGASQSGERQFDWEHKIIMKWGLADIGAALAVLQGRQAQAKLFHQTDAASSSFELTQREDPDKAPYLMSVGRQETADKTLRKVAIPITHAEAALLETALRCATERILMW